ncbi:MAG: protein-export chaperone SecB [Candidatus Comchoanobacterales bacterium]
MNEKTNKFVIENIQTLESSFKATKTVAMLKEKWEPNAQFSIDVAHDSVGEGRYQVQLTCKVQVSIKDEKVFEVSAKQVGGFQIEGYADETLDQILESFCPNILYPYARSVIAEHVNRGNYPPLHLSPVDFESRYRQMKEKKDN